MDNVQAAWVSGLIEGEGTFYISTRDFPRIKVSMTDLDVLERLQDWTEAGSITGPAQRGDHKPIWSWTVTSHADVLRVADEIRPFMLSRRAEKLDQVLAIARAREATQVARRTAPGYRDRRKAKS